MAFRERTAWAGLVITALSVAGYLAVLRSRSTGQALTDVAYQGPLLWSIGLAVVAMILAHVAIAAVWREGAAQADPRDREIERFAQYVSRAFVTIGGLVAMGLAMVDADGFWIANVLYAGFVLSAVLETIATIVAYRRGFQGW